MSSERTWSWRELGTSGEGISAPYLAPSGHDGLPSAQGDILYGVRAAPATQMLKHLDCSSADPSSPAVLHLLAAGWVGFQKHGGPACGFAGPFLKQVSWHSLASCFSLNSRSPREHLKNSEIFYISHSHRHIPSLEFNCIPTTGPKPPLQFLGCSPLTFLEAISEGSNSQDRNKPWKMYQLQRAMST